MAATAPRAAVGIISIGDMGLGVAKLLQAHHYEVLTTTVGRSPSTHTRATSAGITVLPSDVALVEKADYILSIVPPRDAVATANRIIDAWAIASRPAASTNPLYFLDLNAIAPSTARGIDAALASRAPGIRFVDGGIIGAPPKFLGNESTSSTNGSEAHAQIDDDAEELDRSLRAWKRPSIPISGPYSLSDATATPSGPHLAAVLNTKHLAAEIGPASGLKASFAALTKGFYALALQSYTTAHQLSVLPELRAQLGAAFPATLAAADRGVVGMQPKAYRWEGEMREIAETFRTEGGWGVEEEGEEEAGKKAIFDGVAEVYRVVAEETALGTDEGRKDGVEEVVAELARGVRGGKGRGKGKGE
ncbi:putative phosphogluconate nad-binding [Diplodia seriata]|uniref:Putative phosphogluconate nad-binding n=1 Tax=Diplodia seriata TaxID=420778 RepID=A0A0G2FNR0_9PEZI|nr:putative phosphogluconate nad-binding [Diplodia seriata]